MIFLANSYVQPSAARRGFNPISRTGKQDTDRRTQTCLASHNSVSGELGRDWPLRPARSVLGRVLAGHICVSEGCECTQGHQTGWTSDWQGFLNKFTEYWNFVKYIKFLKIASETDIVPGNTLCSK